MANSHDVLVSTVTVAIRFEPVQDRTQSPRHPRMERQRPTTLRWDLHRDHRKMGVTHSPVVLVTLDDVKPALSVILMMFRYHHHANPLVSMRRDSRYVA
jgi:hypothetical protein